MQTLSNEELQMINLLETSTGAKAKDVVLTSSAVIFVLEPGNLGKAIGKQGANIQRLKRGLDKQVDVFEYSESLEGFVRNFFYPVQVIGVEEMDQNGRKTVSVKVDPKNKGLAIGKGGEKIERARLLVKRYFGFDWLKIV